VESYVDDAFWSPRLRANREASIFSQWEHYEEAGTVDNFRIAAGLAEGERRGFFYSDSDLHKWADAACRLLRSPDSFDAGSRSPERARLEALVAEYVRLMALAQEPDGYLFTYNQILFPATRWKNLMIEHELYCLGHFIEAGIAHREATGAEELFALAVKAADLVVRDFFEAPASWTSGHEEIELALLKLYRITRNKAYLDTASALVERRGRSRFFGLRLASQALSQSFRARRARRAGAPSAGIALGENLTKEEPPLIALRAAASFLGGSYQQQHAPVRDQAEPRGHAVRWAYLMTAVAMLYRESGDESLLKLSQAAWANLLCSKLYVTGGLGSLPLVEGFGRPFELDNRYAYAETCAAIGSVLWNRELSLATGEARYADLLEWQLYNAVSCGVSLSGDRYFYRNPLASKGGLERRPWYATACCPSNISRLFADLGELAYAASEGELRIDQYFGGWAEPAPGLRVEVESGLPWTGKVRLKVLSERPLKLKLRAPGWAGAAFLRLGGETVRRVMRSIEPRLGGAPFGAERFERASYLEIDVGAGESALALELGMRIAAIEADWRVKPDRGRFAAAYGPLVYCAESVDNPGLDLEALELDPATLRFERSAPGFPFECGALVGTDPGGRPVKLVPYQLWGNRGPSSMTLWLRAFGSA
jgi:uncharacterized protein